jgi:hypothetical protein
VSYKIKTLTVILMPMATMLREILTTLLAKDADIETLIVDSGTFNVPDNDLVIIASPDPRQPGNIEKWLLPQTTKKVIAISDNGRNATIWQLQPTPTVLAEVSLQELIAAIKQYPLEKP